LPVEQVCLSSIDKMRTILGRAYDQGMIRCVWMHCLCDVSSHPTYITFITFRPSQLRSQPRTTAYSFSGHCTGGRRRTTIETHGQHSRSRQHVPPNFRHCLSRRNEAPGLTGAFREHRFVRVFFFNTLQTCLFEVSVEWFRQPNSARFGEWRPEPCPLYELGACRSLPMGGHSSAPTFVRPFRSRLRP